jgi:AdoMet-dependent rRNA methyltransferase SPB1
MLRKKERQEILFRSYNKYAFDDSDMVPSWFQEEEKLHNVPLTPITKEVNARMPKKVKNDL